MLKKTSSDSVFHIHFTCDTGFVFVKKFSLFLKFL